MPGSTVTQYVDIPDGSLYGLLMSIIKSLTSIAMQANQLSFQINASGVFIDIQYDKEGMIDHGVLSIGFGHDEDTDMNYNRVKNSLGGTWCDKGYVKLKRHSSNE